MFYILILWILSPIWLSIALLRKLFTTHPKRILFMEIAGIGDVVCSAIIFKTFRYAYPNTKIDLMIDNAALPLLELLPMIDSIVPFSYNKQRGILGRLKLAVICAKYDTTICLIPSSAQLFGTCLATTPYRYALLPKPIGWTYKLLIPFLTDYVMHDNREFFLKTQAQLLQKFDKLANIDDLAIDKWLPRDSHVDKASLQLVGILVSSARELKRVEPAKLGEIIIKILNANVNTCVVLIGGINDRSIATQVAAVVNNHFGNRFLNYVGEYSLLELSKILIKFNVFIGVDSGVTHMADALGIPIVCIGGPMNLNEVYKTKNSVKTIIYELECRPCLGVFTTPSKCAIGTLGCIKNIDVDSVVSACMEFLD